MFFCDGLRMEILPPALCGMCIGFFESFLGNTLTEQLGGQPINLCLFSFSSLKAAQS